MKAILVMDMPESCAECEFSCGYAFEDYCSVPGTMIATGSYVARRPDQCPMKPMPERKIELGRQKFYMGEYMQAIDIPIPENKGWNACIDAIEGSKDDGAGND